MRWRRLQDSLARKEAAEGRDKADMESMQFDIILLEKERAALEQKVTRAQQEKQKVIYYIIYITT